MNHKTIGISNHWITFVVLSRTQSWVTLQPHKQRFSPKPVILKPLKLIKLDKRSRKMKWLYGNPWAFQDPKVVKNNASSSLDDSHAMGLAWDWNGEMPRVPGSKLHEEEKQRPRRVKKDWTLKEEREKEDNWADLKIQAVSSGEGSAKSLGKLSPLPVPVRKGVVTARGKREAADGEMSEGEEGERDGDEAAKARAAARRKWQLARSAYRPLPATKRATTAGGEALEIHHDLYGQKQRSHSDSTLDLSAGEDDGEPKPKEDDAVHLAHIEVTQESQSEVKVPKEKNRSRVRRRRRRRRSG